MLLQTTNAPSQYKASFLPARATAWIFEFNVTLMATSMTAEGKLHLPKQHHPRHHVLLLTVKEVQGKSN